MKKVWSDSELSVLGLHIIEARRKGGRMVLKKYGPGYFSKLGKLSSEKRKKSKIGTILTP